MILEKIKTAFHDYFQHLLTGTTGLEINESQLHDDELIESVRKKSFKKV